MAACPVPSDSITACKLGCQARRRFHCRLKRRPHAHRNETLCAEYRIELCRAGEISGRRRVEHRLLLDGSRDRCLKVRLGRDGCGNGRL